MFEFIPRFFKRRFGVDKEYYRFIDEMFGFVPHNIELYKVALIHKSASQSIGGHSINNERLEYLGDAIIESITSDYLFIEFPEGNEGFLTQMRSKLVSRQSLNEVARQIGLDRYVIYNMSGNFAHKHIYGDAFEAMIGAIYLDQGYEFVNRLLINKIYAKYMNLAELTESECDFKSRLIEWCQKNHHKVAFRTRTVNMHRSAPAFYTTVLIDGIEVGHGSGDSKKAAEQNAAGSVSHQMSDEECADLLDKFDDLRSKITSGNIARDGAESEQSENGEHSRSSRSRRRRRRRAASAENSGNSGAQQNDITVAAAETEAHKDIKTGSDEPQKQSVANVKPVAEPQIVAEEPAAEEKTKRTRAPRRRKNADGANTVAEAETTSTEIAAQTPAEDITAEKKTPRRRRSPKPAAENAETTASNAQQSASDRTTVADAAETDIKAPSKTRRTAKPKAAAEPSKAELSENGQSGTAEEKPRTATRRKKTAKTQTAADAATAETPSTIATEAGNAQSEEKRPTKKRRTRKAPTADNRVDNGAAASDVDETRK